MKKVVMSAVAALAFAAPAIAADVPVKAKKVVAAPATPAWDIAFGGLVMSDYIFRGISQSNTGASGGAYFEPQFNTAIGQFYVGIAALAISWPTNLGFTDPSAEIDIYGGWRKSWGPVSVDLGALYYHYPSETRSTLTSQSDFWEIYAKLGYAFTPDLSIGVAVYYTPDLLNYSQSFGSVAGVPGFDTEAIYASFTAKWVTPFNFNGVGAFISGEIAYWSIDDSGFTNALFVAANGNPALDPSYAYWNVGLGITYKAFTLDLRYHGTDQSVRECASFLLVAVPNGSNGWCDERFVASLKFDTTLSALR